MSPSTSDRHLPLTLELALPAGAVVFIVMLKTRPWTEAGWTAAAVFLVILFAPGLLRATGKTATALAKPRKKPKSKK